MRELFIISHPDDESYGPYGTILNLSQQKKEVFIFCLCNGSKPKNEHVSKERIEIFKENCRDANVNYILGNNLDLKLDTFKITSEIENVIKDINPTSVYTHSMTDINRDHRLVFEASLVASRPKLNGTVNNFYTFEVPSSTDWSFSHINSSFKPNVYNEISEKNIELKKIALSKYSTEIYDYPDARSVESMFTLSKYRGYQVGFKYAEAFELIFLRSKL